MGFLASRYDPTWAVLLFWIPAMIAGYFLFRKSQNDLKTGKVKGVKPSATFFDWMFYNYRDRE